MPNEVSLGSLFAMEFAKLKGSDWKEKVGHPQTADGFNLGKAGRQATGIRWGLKLAWNITFPFLGGSGGGGVDHCSPPCGNGSVLKNKKGSGECFACSNIEPWHSPKMNRHSQLLAVTKGRAVARQPRHT